MLSNSKKKLIYRITALVLTAVLSVGMLFAPTVGVFADEPETEEKGWPEAPEITAEAAILIETTTGTILYEKNAKEAKFPASTTKLMSVLLAIERCPLSDVVTMTKDAITTVGWDSSRIGVVTDEQLTMEECLYAILLASANEVTYAVGEHVAGSMAKFVKMMNERAKELGCVNTNFVNPHGLHDDEHYTCAYDLALIMKKCIEYTAFCRISNNYYHEIPATNLCKDSRVIAQTHQILRKKVKYDGVFAGKTGHTDEAGNCLVTACERDGLNFICVVMKEPESENCYTDTIALFDYGYNNFYLCTTTADDEEKTNAFPVLFSDDEAFRYKVKSSLSVSDATVLLPNNVSFDDVENRCELDTLLKIEKGENVIGTANFYFDGVKVGQTSVIYNSDTEEVLDAAALYLQEYGETEAFSQEEYDRLSGIEPEPEPEPEKDMRPMIIGVIVGVLTLVLGLFYIARKYRG